MGVLDEAVWAPDDEEDSLEDDVVSVLEVREVLETGDDDVAMAPEVEGCWLQAAVYALDVLAPTALE